MSLNNVDKPGALDLYPLTCRIVHWLQSSGLPAPARAIWPLAIAEEFNGEIVNCDSLQVFRHFDIGTAKLPPEERRGIPTT